MAAFFIVEAALLVSDSRAACAFSASVRASVKGVAPWRQNARRWTRRSMSRVGPSSVPAIALGDFRQRGLARAASGDVAAWRAAGLARALALEQTLLPTVQPLFISPSMSLFLARALVKKVS